MRRQVRFSALIVIVATVGVQLALPRIGSSWGNQEAHPTMTDVGLGRGQQKIEETLRVQYGLSDGLSAELGLMEGVGLVEVADELASNRFREILVWPGPNLLAEPLRVELNPACPEGEGLDACLQSIQRYTIDHLIRAGTVSEDNPNNRAAHHFHDPAGVHGDPQTATPAGFPADSRGQDNTTVLFDGSFDESAASLLTNVFRGGGDFRLFGWSARDRALRLRNAEIGEPTNYFDLPSAERYLFRSVTSSDPREREQYLALHMLAVGSALHLLEDMSSVAHTRNDFIVDHIYGLLPIYPFGPSLEARGDTDTAIQILLSLAGDDVDLFASRPAAFLEALDANRFGGEFLSAIPAADTSNFDAGDFWDRESDSSAPNDLGLSQYSNRYFFSAGTINNEDPMGDPLSYALPLVPSCGSLGQVVGQGQGLDRIEVRELPRRPFDPAESASEFTSELRYLSSSLVPHLARCRFHGIDRVGSTAVRIGFSTTTVIDESVQRDYVELLFALGVHYTQKFLEFYFQPRIDLVPIGGNRFELFNRSRQELEASADELRVYYDDVDGGRSNLLLNCGVSGSRFVLQPDQFLICELPSTLPDGNAAPVNRWNFAVALRGRLGERGSVVDPSDEWESSEFVTAVYQVRGARIAYEGVRRGDTRRDPADVEDRTLVRDVYEMAFALPGEEASFEPDSWARNLTESYRSQLSDVFAEQVDFSAPSAEPGGSRIAFSSDIRIENGSVLNVAQGSEFGFRVVSDVEIMDLRNPDAFFSTPALASLNLPSCDAACPPVWDSEADSNDILFSVGAPSSTAIVADGFARAAAGGAPSETSFPLRDINITSVNGARMAGIGRILNGIDPRPVYVANSVTGVATHLIDLEAFSVVGCMEDVDPSICAAPDSAATFYGADPQISPDGSRVVLTVYQDPELDLSTGTNRRRNGAIYVADLNTDTLQLLSEENEEATYPVWSPDGQWIAFQRTDDGHLYVIPSSGGTAVRVSSQIATRVELTWQSTLALP